MQLLDGQEQLDDVELLLAVEQLDDVEQLDGQELLDVQEVRPFLKTSRKVSDEIFDEARNSLTTSPFPSVSHPLDIPPDPFHNEGVSHPVYERNDMSAGNKICPIRIPPELLEAIQDAINSRNEKTREEPWTRTGFIITAIREKLAHRERSNRRKAKPQEVKA